MAGRRINATKLETGSRAAEAEGGRLSRPPAEPEWPPAGATHWRVHLTPVLAICSHHAEESAPHRSLRRPFVRRSIFSRSAVVHV